MAGSAVRCLAACLLAVNLTACGFQLRGAFAVPDSMASTYVDGSPRSEVYVDLKRALAASGVNVVEVEQAASAVLSLRAERSGQRVLSVGQDANVSEYEVFYQVQFDVRRREEPSGSYSYLIEPQTLRLTRDYVYDQTDVLGKRDERELLTREMQRDAVRLIMFRIEGAAR